MKKILSILIGLVIILFITLALYVLGVPPFQEGGPFIPLTTQQTTQQTVQKVPEFLSEEKIGRAKSYDEHIKKADLFEQNGFPDLAIKELEAAVQMDSTKTQPLIKIGKINLRQNDFIKAKVAIQQALNIDPGNTEIKIYLIRALLGDRKIADSQKILDTITTEKDNQNSKYYKGIVAAYYGDYDKSKNLLKSAVTIATSEDITTKAKNFLSAFDEFAAINGGTPEHLKTLLSRSFNQVGEYQMAIPLLFDVVKTRNDYRDAWIMLGYAYLNIEKYQDAVEALETAKKLDSEKPENLFYLGLSYYGLNDLPKASSNLELAKKNGYQPVIQIDQKLAEIYLQMKQYKASAQNYENVLSLNSGEINYYIKPIWIYLERTNEPEKALVLAQKAAQAHPGTAMGYNLIGWASIYANKFDDAEKFLTQAKNLDPNLDAVYLNFGLLNEKRGQNMQATTFYKKAFAMGNGNSVSASAADRYNKLIGKMNDLEYATLKANVLANPK